MDQVVHALFEGCDAEEGGAKAERRNADAGPTEEAVLHGELLIPSSEFQVLSSVFRVGQLRARNQELGTGLLDRVEHRAIGAQRVGVGIDRFATEFG